MLLQAFSLHPHLVVVKMPRSSVSGANCRVVLKGPEQKVGQTPLWHQEVSVMAGHMCGRTWPCWDWGSVAWKMPSCERSWGLRACEWLQAYCLLERQASPWARDLPSSSPFVLCTPAPCLPPSEDPVPLDISNNVSRGSGVFLYPLPSTWLPENGAAPHAWQELRRDETSICSGGMKGRWGWPLQDLPAVDKSTADSQVLCEPLFAIWYTYPCSLKVKGYHPLCLKTLGRGEERAWLPLGCWAAATQEVFRRASKIHRDWR